MPLDDEGNVDGNKKIRFNESAMLRRKIRLEQFFKTLGFGVRLIGNPNTPAIILDESICVSAFVHNFNLIFTNQPSQGAHLLKLKLEHEPQFNLDEVFRVLLASEHRPVFGIRYAHSDLFLAGYNFIDRKTSFGKYPVFARQGNGTKIYFDRSYAESVCEEFKSDYQLIVYDPKPVDFQLKWEKVRNTDFKKNFNAPS